MMQQQCVIVKAAEWKKYKAEVTCKRLLSGNMDARRGREEPTNAAFSLTSKVDCKMISSLFLRGEMEPALAQTWRAFNVVKGSICTAACLRACVRVAMLRDTSAVCWQEEEVQVKPQVGFSQTRSSLK
ncbi:uncharacterized protein LOC144026706 isoform X1 [Festucalex cinctus]